MVDDDGEQERETLNLEGLLFKKEREISRIKSDINQNGEYGISWLIITNKRLITFDESFSKKDPLYSIFLEDIKILHIRNFFGNGLIELSTQKKTLDLIRFSDSLLSKFYIIVNRINKLLKERNLDVELDEDLEMDDDKRVNICPKCGRVIPEGYRVCPDCIDKKKTFKRLLKYIKPFPKLVTKTLFLSVLVTVISLLPQYLPKILIDEVFMKQNAKLLPWMVAALLIVHILSSSMNAYRGYMLDILGQKILFKLRTELFTHMQKLSPSFYDKQQTGSIMARVIGDVNALRNFMAQGLQNIIVHGLTVIIVTICLLLKNWQLGLFALSPLPIIWIGTVFFGKRVKNMWHRVRRRSSELNGILGDKIPGMKIVKAFNKEDEEIDRLVNKQMELYHSNLAASKLAHTVYPSLGFTMIIGASLIWSVGGKMVLEGFKLQAQGIAPVFTIGDFILFNGMMWRLFQPIQMLSQISVAFQQTATSAERIFEILDTEPDIKDHENAIELKEIKGGISFENISFGYEKIEPVLKNINLEIKPGETIGLVGKSGSGKTTLVNLLARFYNPSSGQIKIDGIPIENIKIKSLRDEIAMVLQEPFLFHATIFENIAYGKEGASIEEVIWAAKMANAHKFIAELSEGYDTRLGERGIGLSGGQKQRIAIARAILRNPKILILDEATSAVDTKTEHLIQEAIDRLVKNRTTIAIAHRLSTLKNADRIVTMEKGRIVEIGTHNELMKNNGIYANLVKMQTRLQKVE